MTIHRTGSDEARLAKRWRAISVLLFATVVGLIPIRTTVAPPISLTIRDETGRPLSESFVREVWSHRFLSERQFEKTTLSSLGSARLPAATIDASLLQRLWTSVRLLSDIPAHENLGRHSRLYVWAPGYLPWERVRLHEATGRYSIVLRRDTSWCAPGSAAQGAPNATAAGTGVVAGRGSSSGSEGR